MLIPLQQYVYGLATSLPRSDPGNRLFFVGQIELKIQAESAWMRYIYPSQAPTRHGTGLFTTPLICGNFPQVRMPHGL
jgi:hypothetical protein